VDSHREDIVPFFYFVESPDSFFETTKEIGGKASGVARQARLTKDVSLRKVDSVIPRQRRQNVIARFVGKVKKLESRA
jgi:hypothetical protein